MTDIYKSLAMHLDKLPGGYPETEEGVELRILKRLFTPEEAGIAVGLTMLPEPVDKIAERLEIHPETLAPELKRMSHKGLIFRQTRKQKTYYMAAQFVIGIWEYHVNDLDEGLIQDFNAYAPYLTQQWTQQKTKQFRVVPISKSLDAEMETMPYEIAEQIIKKQSKIVVAPCICRKEHQMAGKGCDNPLDVCLCFGSGAYYYEENGLGRSISNDEALSILHRGIEAGLVLQPGNSKKPMNICMCCGCCCQVLKNLKTIENPAQTVNANYYAEVTESECVGCGFCAERCHMDAIKVDNTAAINLDRCIGCGVCTPVCDTEAIRLQAKPVDQRQEPPATVFETYLNIAKERNLI